MFLIHGQTLWRIFLSFFIPNNLLILLIDELSNVSLKISGLICNSSYYLIYFQIHPYKSSTLPNMHPYSLVLSSDLPLLVYLEGVQLKEFWRWRIVKSKFEGSLHLVDVRVVLRVFGIGVPLYFAFLRCSLLWLALHFFRSFLS